MPEFPKTVDDLEKKKFAQAGEVRVDNSYYISRIDSQGSTKYFGYLNTFGDWYILKLTETEATYLRGVYDPNNLTTFLTTFNNRLVESFDEYHIVFPPIV